MISGGAQTAETVVASVSESATPSLQLTLTLLYSTVSFGVEELTVTEIFIHLVSLTLSVGNIHVLLPDNGAGTADVKVTFASYVSVTLTPVAIAFPVFFTIIV